MVATDVAGRFEAHVTVSPGDPAAFRASCAALGVGCVQIELATGAHATQPMTASHHRGTLEDVKREVTALGAALAAAGFEVLRIKIEALPGSIGIPNSDEEAAATPERYFEYHLKLVVPAGLELSAITAVCRPLDAHVSGNAFARHADEVAALEERFVTLRVRAGKRTGDAKLAALEAAIQTIAGVRIVKRITEYTVYDSALSLDRGWL